MQGLSYCTAQKYDLRQLDRLLSAHRPTQLFRDCLYCKISGSGEEACEAFFFDYGVIVLWNASDEQCDMLLRMVRDCERSPFASRVEDSFSFDAGNQAFILNDHITLPNLDPMSKLAFSQGIAQSTKLSVFEDSLDRVIKETHYLPEELAKKGKVPLSRREIRKLIGRLFLERSFINLHSEILDTPEFFWEFSELEPLYQMAAKNWDIFPRVDVLNKRLDIVHGLLEILSEELKYQHTSTLELIIILLITGELVLQLRHL